MHQNKSRADPSKTPLTTVLVSDPRQVSARGVVEFIRRLNESSIMIDLSPGLTDWNSVVSEIEQRLVVAGKLTEVQAEHLHTTLMYRSPAYEEKRDSDPERQQQAARRRLSLHDRYRCAHG